MADLDPQSQPSFFRHVYERFFPRVPDFFLLLSEQCVQAAHTAGLLIEFMETGDPAIARGCANAD